VPRVGPRLQRRSMPYFERVVRRYCLPFPGSDASIVRRSQQWLVQHEVAPVGGEAPQPVQFGAYFTLPSAWWVGVTMFVGAIFTTLARFAWGRSLLLRFPKLFTFGVCVFVWCAATRSAPLLLLGLPFFSLSLCLNLSLSVSISLSLSLSHTHTHNPTRTHAYPFYCFVFVVSLMPPGSRTKAPASSSCCRLTSR
jgi:hypothetical protein